MSEIVTTPLHVLKSLTDSSNDPFANWDELINPLGGIGQSMYINIAVLSLMIVLWDGVLQASHDYTILRRFPLRLPTAVYLLSRITCFAYLLLTLVVVSSVDFTTAGCRLVNQARLWLFVVAQGLTAFLFFLRARAIYERGPWATWTFLVFWGICVVGASMIPPLGGSFLLDWEIGPVIDDTPPMFCSPERTSWQIIVPVLGPLLYDTVIFGAIAWKLAQIATPDPRQGTTVRTRIQTMFLGTALPSLAKSLLRDGQSYYLLSIVANIVDLVVLLYYSHSFSYRGFAGDPSFALIHVCACRVFRSTKLGLGLSPTSSTVLLKGLSKLTAQERGEVLDAIATGTPGEWEATEAVLARVIDVDEEARSESEERSHDC